MTTFFQKDHFFKKINFQKRLFFQKWSFFQKPRIIARSTFSKQIDQKLNLAFRSEAANHGGCPSRVLSRVRTVCVFALIWFKSKNVFANFFFRYLVIGKTSVKMHNRANYRTYRQLANKFLSGGYLLNILRCSLWIFIAHNGV